MTVTGFGLVLLGVFALVFVGSVHAEMRARTREREALIAAGTAVIVRRHVRRHYYRLAVRLLAPVAVLIDNALAPMRGLA